MSLVGFLTQVSLDFLPFPPFLLPSSFHLTCVLSSRHKLGVKFTLCRIVICSDKWLLKCIQSDLGSLRFKHKTYLFWVYLNLWCCVPPSLFFPLSPYSLWSRTYIDLPVSVCQVLELKTYHHTWPFVVVFFSWTPTMFFCLFFHFVCLYTRLTSNFLWSSCLNLLIVAAVAIGHHARQHLNLGNSIRKAAVSCVSYLSVTLFSQRSVQ